MTPCFHQGQKEVIHEDAVLWWLPCPDRGIYFGENFNLFGSLCQTGKLRRQQMPVGTTVTCWEPERSEYATFSFFSG